MTKRRYVKNRKRYLRSAVMDQALQSKILVDFSYTHDWEVVACWLDAVEQQDAQAAEVLWTELRQGHREGESFPHLRMIYAPWLKEEYYWSKECRWILTDRRRSPFWHKPPHDSSWCELYRGLAQASSVSVTFDRLFREEEVQQLTGAGAPVDLAVDAVMSSSRGSVPGQLRYNTVDELLEVFVNDTWQPVVPRQQTVAEDGAWPFHDGLALPTPRQADAVVDAAKLDLPDPPGRTLQVLGSSFPKPVK